QARLSDDVRRAAGALAVEELGGGERRSPDRLFRDVDAHAAEPGSQVAWGVDGVVRQDEEWPVTAADPGDELVRSGDQLSFVNEHTVHVGQPRLDRPALGHRMCSYCPNFADHEPQVMIST